VGNDTTSGALRIYFQRNVIPKVNLIRETVAAGKDPQFLNLEGVSKKEERNRGGKG
jgi:hypothetical protein